ncbi:MAG: hypothetical protein P8X82_01860 [Gemmatimonadales bacterium]|jgi:hypothetical protein
MTTARFRPGKIQISTESFLALSHRSNNQRGSWLFAAPDVRPHRHSIFGIRQFESEENL